MLRQPRTSIFNGVPFTFPMQAFRFYVLDEEFTTSASAPLASPRTCEPGPGTLDITDSSNVLSISSDQLHFAAGGTTNDPKAYSSSALARLVGRTGLIKFTPFTPGNALEVGWSDTGGLFHTSGVFQFLGSGSIISVADASINYQQALSWSGVSYQAAFVMRGTGMFFLIKGGIFTNWTLLWVGTVGSLNLKIGAEATGATKAGDVEYMRVIDLHAPFDSDYGIASVHTAAVSGTDYSASANLIADLTITAPGTLANTAGLKFRKSSGDYWKVWFDSSGNLLVQRFAADVGQGSPVTLATSVITGSGTRTMRVIANGSALDFFTLSGSTWTKRGSTQTDSVLTANTGIAPFADSGWSLGNVDAYGRTSSLYDVLDSI